MPTRARARACVYTPSKTVHVFPSIPKKKQQQHWTRRAEMSANGSGESVLANTAGESVLANTAGESVLANTAGESALASHRRSMLFRVRGSVQRLEARIAPRAGDVQDCESRPAPSLANRMVDVEQSTRRSLSASRRGIVYPHVSFFYEALQAAVENNAFDAASVDSVLSAFVVLVAAVYTVAYPTRFDTARMVRSLESFTACDKRMCSTMRNPPACVSREPAAQLAAMQARCSPCQMCHKKRSASDSQAVS